LTHYKVLYYKGHNVVESI